jgi:hypothetical protein
MQAQPTSKLLAKDAFITGLSDRQVNHDETCNSCHEDLEVGEADVVSLPCNHDFHHRKCLVPW